MIDCCTFVFLNQTGKVSSASSWNDANADKLWLYHLHYFDDLNTQHTAQRLEWHRAIIDRWIVENPVGVGNGWEPYPISRRVVNWIKWILAGNAPSALMLENLCIQVRYLMMTLEWHLLGNHLLANAKALAFAGVFFTGPEAEKWFAKGMQILKEQFAEQVLEDGGHFERSPMYHSIILEDILDLLNLSRAFPSEFCQRWFGVPDQWLHIIYRMRLWLKNMCHPDGEIALFNDAAFKMAPTVLELEDYARRLKLPEVPDPKDGITHLAESGYVRLQRGVVTLILDVGSVGPDYLPGHAHAETLTFELSLGTHRVIVNSGTSCYGTGSERERQRSTAAHNTVVVNGENSSEVWGGFRVARRARTVQLDVLTDSDGGLVVTCAHDGYRRLPGKNIHQRTWRLHDCNLEIKDTISGTYSSAAVTFHLDPGVRELQGVTQPSAAIEFGVGEHSISWSSSGVVGSLDKSTYHPQFGVAMGNLLIKAQFKSGRSTNVFSWC